MAKISENSTITVSLVIVACGALGSVVVWFTNVQATATQAKEIASEVRASQAEDAKSNKILSERLSKMEGILDVLERRTRNLK